MRSGNCWEQRGVFVHGNSSIPSNASDSLFLECACFKTLRRLRFTDKSISIWPYQLVDVTREWGIIAETSTASSVSKPVFLNLLLLSSHTIFLSFLKIDFSPMTEYAPQPSPWRLCLSLSSSTFCTLYVFSDQIKPCDGKNFVSLVLFHIHAA